MNFIHQCLSLAAALRDPATRRLNVRLFGSTLILVLLAGCAEPVLVHTRQELIQHLGQKVAVEGLYEIGTNGEIVRSNDIEVSLDVNPDVLGFGRPPLTNGLPVRASGTVARGAMSLGIFIDADIISASRGRADHPLVPGFVLRDAKVAMTAHPTTQPSSGTK